jgi:hypothetical protein
MIMKRETRTLSTIAQEIMRDWKNVSIDARGYLQAMRELESIRENYYLDSGREIVARFLANAGTWKGDNARRIKRELDGMLKSSW